MNVETQAGKAVANKVSGLCSRNWWVFLIGGIASVIFGVLAFINPGIALLVLAMFFAAYVLVDGAVNIWGALSNRDKDGWWVVLLLGIAGVIVGGYALLVPPVSMLALIYVIAFIAMFNGVTFIYLGWKIREDIENEWILFLVGIMSVLFALLIMFNPLAGGVSIVYIIATWAILIGALRIWFGFKIRNVGEQVQSLVE
jgi:uncharacterized membrane protein HdeD (DUF308 family)